jgi:hypothetical protein
MCHKIDEFNMQHKPYKKNIATIFQSLLGQKFQQTKFVSTGRFTRIPTGCFPGYLNSVIKTGT